MVGTGICCQGDRWLLEDMHYLTERSRFLISLAIALCALINDGTLRGQQPSMERTGPQLPPVIDGRDYRQAIADGRLPPVHAALTRSISPTVERVSPVARQPENVPAPRDRESAEPVRGREQIPPDATPWWQEHVGDRLRDGDEFHPIDLDALIVSALAFSPRVRGVSEDVLIQETAIMEAQAAFDVHAFMDSKFFRKSDPIGNVLETGGPPRLREGDFGYSAGLRKRTPLGGSWEMSQRIGMRDSNSQFFEPKQQGNSRLSLSFNQPLLNGFGNSKTVKHVCNTYGV